MSAAFVAAVLQHTDKKGQTEAGHKGICKSVRLGTIAASPTQPDFSGALAIQNPTPGSSCASLPRLGLKAMPVFIQNYRRGPDSGHPLAIFDARLEPSGLVLHDCMLHQTNGKMWVSLPARPQITKDSRVLLSPKNSKPCYTACITFADNDRRELFQRLALEAVDRLRGREGAE